MNNALNTTSLNITPLHPRYGVRVEDIQLSDIDGKIEYPLIRAAFENSSLLYFSNQDFSDQDHLRLGLFFGPKEDRTVHSGNPDPDISIVSNVKQGDALYQVGDQKLLDLQSNMLWHTDSTFLPAPALTNILVGRVIPASGTATQFASTRAAWADMPDNLKDRTREQYFRHHYSHSRRKLDSRLAEEEKFTHWGEQIWKSVWTNPRNGEEALYIASHVCGIVGVKQDLALELINELTAWCTQDRYIYTHQWNKNDVLIWDERAVLHRGVPWNYDEARTLSSICITATAADGLDSMRFVA